MKYYITKNIHQDFESAVNITKEALKEEGFGVLSEINIHEKLKEKLDVDFPKYKILGACNPPLAYDALKIDDKIGTMLPCNVIVREIKTAETEITAIDPLISMQVVANSELNIVATKVRNKLAKVIERL